MSDSKGDFQTIDDGSLVGFTIISAEAQNWCDEHLPEDAPRMGPTYWVEHRYALPILQGMEEHGLIRGR